jgi:hypothetical protein
LTGFSGNLILQVLFKKYRNYPVLDRIFRKFDTASFILKNTETVLFWTGFSANLILPVLFKKRRNYPVLDRIFRKFDIASFI